MKKLSAGSDGEMGVLDQPATGCCLCFSNYAITQFIFTNRVV